MSVQIPQGRAGAMIAYGTYLTTRQRNKDKEEETSKTLHAISRKDDRKNDHKIRLPGSPLGCVFFGNGFSVSVYLRRRR